MRPSGPLTIEEVLELPAAVDIETTARALNIGRDKAYRLVRSGQFPITVLQLGTKRRCRLIDICEFLGIRMIAGAPARRDGGYGLNRAESAHVQARSVGHIDLVTASNQTTHRHDGVGQSSQAREPSMHHHDRLGAGADHAPRGDR